MKHNYKVWLFFDLTLGFSGFALADTATEDAAGIFLGLKAGYQVAEDANYDHSAPDSGILGVYGGVRFSKEWSWDIGYQNHGTLEAQQTSVEIDTWLIDSALRYDWYWQNNWSLYGRLGAAYWNMEKSNKSNRSQVDAEGFSPLGEVGVNYDFNPNLRLSAGYQYIHGIGDSGSGDYDSHAAMLSLFYTLVAQNSSSAPVVTESRPVEPEETPVVKETAPQIHTFSESNMGGDYSFQTGSAAIDARFTNDLKKFSSLLVQYPHAQVHVTGHADSTGSASFNQKLSTQRAQVVADELKKQGVRPEQITVTGKGELEPVASNDTAQGRAQNRRVELVIPTFEYKK